MYRVTGDGGGVTVECAEGIARVTRQRVRCSRLAYLDPIAHVGDGLCQPVDFVGRARLQAADDELIASMCAGDAEGFFGAIRRDGDRRNVCGLAPIYLTLRALSPVEGAGVAYDRCPADQNGTSLVSICGVVFS